MSKLGNPQKWEYSHPNFNGGTSKVSLSNTHETPAIDRLVYESPTGQVGGGQIEHQDNGTGLVRIDLRGNTLGAKLIHADGSETVHPPV